MEAKKRRSGHPGEVHPQPDTEIGDNVALNSSGMVVFGQAPDAQATLHVVRSQLFLV